MSEKITVLIASVKQREQQLEIVIDRIAQQHGEYKITVHLVLNFYDEIPAWLSQFDFAVPHLNPENTNAHDAIWNYVPRDGYVFVMDDDIYYPLDFFDKLIDSLERHKRRVVVTAHGSNIITPAIDYMMSRQTWGFTDRLERDIFNSLCGVGVCAFNTDTIKPKLEDFRIPFMRDLYFSKLCLRENVKIVNIQRPEKWLMPLTTPGTSVYDTTVDNVDFRALKNQVFKTEFLPLLHKSQHGTNNQWVLINDAPKFDERLLSKTLSTLVDVSPNVNIAVFSDRQKDYSFWNDRWGAQTSARNQPGGKRPVLTVYVTPEEMAIGRMGSKMVTQYRFINALPDGSQVISADADLYFLRNPFTAFYMYPFDIGVTTRCEPYKYSINGGVVMFRVNARTKCWLDFAIQEAYSIYGSDKKRSWDILEQFEKKHGHNAQQNRNSWYIDQNFWCCSFDNPEEVYNFSGARILDIGPTFNYCPHSDGSQKQIALGKAKLMRAYHDESVSVLHLKSQLKELLFAGLLL